MKLVWNQLLCLAFQWFIVITWLFVLFMVVHPRTMINERKKRRHPTLHYFCTRRYRAGSTPFIWRLTFRGTVSVGRPIIKAWIKPQLYRTRLVENDLVPLTHLGIPHTWHDHPLFRFYGWSFPSAKLCLCGCLYHIIHVRRISDAV
jgi:hypothetical protein